MMQTQARFKINIWLVNTAVILIAVFFLAIVVYGATTIGNNINTAGNLVVDGNASTTNATTTAYLYVGADVTEPPGWNFSEDLIVSGDTFLNNQATSSVSFWVGSAGTADSINMTGGDLYVQDDVEIDGSATGTSLYLSDDLTVAGKASTTGDGFFLGGTLALSTGTSTSTAGLFVGPTAGTGTTTIGVGDSTQDGCIEITSSAKWYVVYVNTAGTGLVVAEGRCNP